MSATDPADHVCRRRAGRHRTCGRPLREHVGDDRLCPFALGSPVARTFLGHTTSPARASTSMNVETANVLAELCKRALAGGDVRAFARLNAAAVGRLLSIARSVQARVAVQAGGGAGGRGRGGAGERGARAGDG